MTPAARLLPLIPILALTACYSPPAGGGGRAHASAATIAACGKRADEVYLRQNRDEIYRADTYVGSTRDSPFSGGGQSGITTAGLSGRYARDSYQEACLNSANGPGGDSSDPATALAPAGSPAVSPPRVAPKTR